MNKDDINKVHSLIIHKKYSLANRFIDLLLKKQQIPILILLKTAIFSIQKKYKNAKKTLEIISERKLEPEMLGSFLTLKSLILFKLKDKQAVYYAKRAEKISNNPISNNTNTLILFGMIYRRYNKRALTNKIYKKILKMDPHNLITLRNAFLLKLQEKKLKEANKIIDKVLKIKLEPIALSFKGLILGKIGKLLEAEKYYRKTKELFKKFNLNKETKAEILQDFSNLLIKSHKFQEALKTIREAQVYDPKNKKILSLRRRLKDRM